MKTKLKKNQEMQLCKSMTNADRQRAALGYLTLKKYGNRNNRGAGAKRRSSCRSRAGNEDYEQPQSESGDFA